MENMEYAVHGVEGLSSSTRDYKIISPAELKTHAES